MNKLLPFAAHLPPLLNEYLVKGDFLKILTHLQRKIYKKALHVEQIQIILMEAAGRQAVCKNEEYTARDLQRPWICIRK